VCNLCRFKAGSNFSPLLPPKPKVVQEDTENPEEEDFYEPGMCSLLICVCAEVHPTQHNML
jgi:hypothetical protein